MSVGLTLYGLNRRTVQMQVPTQCRRLSRSLQSPRKGQSSRDLPAMALPIELMRGRVCLRASVVHNPNDAEIGVVLNYGFAAALYVVADNSS